MLNSRFDTLVTELGKGLQCTANLTLRTTLSASNVQHVSGIGFSPNALSARFAAEGEALERATWQFGALWNTVYFPDLACTFPEETQLILSAEHLKRLSESPCAALPLYTNKDANNPPSQWCPAEAVFFFPKLSQTLQIHAVTTGWAYHSSKEEATAQGYREVIERDLQMLFWFGRLKPYLQCISDKQMQDWMRPYAPTEKIPLQIVQMAVSLPKRFGGIAYFTLAICMTEEKPYLSIGSALKTDAQGSFQNALGECLMLRSHQYEQLLSGITEAPDNSYSTHVIRATRETKMRDKTIGLFSTQTQAREASLKEPRLDYQHQPYYVTYLKPPPVTQYGYVAKVWVDGCQGMVPIGFPYGVTKRWQQDWGINATTWEDNRWHPYP